MISGAPKPGGVVSNKKENSIVSSGKINFPNISILQTLFTWMVKN
jgi:hypothetical protein